jgi:hypothetical protein
MLKLLLLGAVFSWPLLGTTPPAPHSSTVLQQQQKSPMEQANRLVNDARFVKNAKELEGFIQKLEALLQQYPELRTTKITDTRFTGDELLAQWKTKFAEMSKTEMLEARGNEVAQAYKKAGYAREPGEAQADEIIEYLELVDSAMKTIEDLVAKTPELKGYKLPDIRITPEEAIAKLDAKGEKAAKLIGVYELKDILRQFTNFENDPDSGNAMMGGEGGLEGLAKRMDDNAKLMETILKANPALAKQEFSVSQKVYLGEQIGPECKRRAARAREIIVELRQSGKEEAISQFMRVVNDLPFNALITEVNKRAQTATNAKTMPDILNALSPYQAVMTKLESLNKQLKQRVVDKPFLLEEKVTIGGKPVLVKDFVAQVSSAHAKANKDYQAFAKKYEATLDTFQKQFDAYVKKNIKGDRKAIYAQRGGPNAYDGPEDWVMPEKLGAALLKSPFWRYDYYDRQLDINCTYVYRFNGDKLIGTERKPNIC